jgi:MFS family permease
MVTMGRLGDVFGRRRVLYSGVIVFALASFLAGTSPSAEFLIACRTIQGIASAVVLTCGAALVTHHFPEDEQGRALGVFMSITGFGLAIGPVLGGLFVTALSWRWAFYVNVPVIILGFLISHNTVQETPRDKSQKVDWPGLAFLIPAVAGLVVGTMQGNDWGWGSAATLSTFAVGIVCLAAFVRIERRVPQPIIDFKLLRNRQLLATVVAAVSLGGFIALGTFLAPLYLQNLHNQTPIQTGLTLLSISGMVVLVPPLISRLAERFGPIPFVVAGQACLALGALVQLSFAPASPIWLVLFGLGLFGVGWGLQQATAATAALPKSAAGIAIAALGTFWNVGSCIAMAIGGLLFEYRDRASLDAAIARDNIALSHADAELVRSLLSDPSRAHDVLSKLAPGAEAKILPHFQEAFMAGYAGAIWYLLITCVLGSVLVYMTGMRRTDN